MSKWLILFAIGIVVEIGVFATFLHNRKVNTRGEGADADDSGVELSWEAGDCRPVQVLYIFAVFGAFIIFALLVKGSLKAIIDLIAACVTTSLGFMLGLVAKPRLQITQEGLRRIKVHGAKREDELLFAWDELQGIKRSRHGFKYFLKEDVIAVENTENEKGGKKKKRPTKSFVPVGKQVNEVLNVIESHCPSTM